ncbi:ATPase [Clostridium acetobutylicum]|nr:ATPase [Clostridium acetobutylicum]
MATYTIFAGVNGAGKTSIYESIYYKENKNEKRINTDEMVAKIGSWQDNALQIKCARQAVRRINCYIRNDVSFNQETTLSGKSIVKHIKKAKQRGFYIIMNFICVDNSRIAKERVKLRVLKGGHGIEEETIERRYYKSLENLKKVFYLCNEINIYDNTDKFKHIAYVCDGVIRWRRNFIPE